MKKNNYYLLLLFPIFIFAYAASTSTSSSREQTFDYFVLASVFTILILLLPRLKEFTLNEKGLSVKVLEQLNTKVAEVKNLIDSGQTTRLTNDQNFQKELNDKITALKESINAYSALIDKK